MSQQAALLLTFFYILWLLAQDVRRRPGLSKAVWLAVFWVVIIGSRPVSTWFSFSGGAGGQAEAYDEGNPVERLVYFFLIGAGMFVLARRGVQWKDVMRSNRWLFVFFLYWGASILWSDAPFVAFKRWIKDIGNIIIVLVVLTEEQPVEASKAVFIRSACLLVPCSVLLIKFFSELGRTYHVWSGEMMYTGVATHKNTLGTMVLVCGLFLFWDFTERFRNKQFRRVDLISDGSLLVLCLWLIITAHSATALGCGVLGALVITGLRLPVVSKRIGKLELYVIVGGISLWFLNSVFDLASLIIVKGFGRDMTLTTRTEVWPMLIGKSESLLFGSGFNSFWSGDRLATIYGQLGIIQAHNGYLETYLNGGLCAVLLLFVLLVSATRTVKNELVSQNDFARIKFAFIIIAILYDLTEAAFNKMGIVWFVLLLAIVRMPKAQLASKLALEASVQTVPIDTETSESYR
jgi:exopolysaccharide production protein ExoQ